MTKLFEIPVYAFRRDTLYKRYKQRQAKLIKKHESVTGETMRRALEMDTYPFRLWDYNHVVGYIRISIDGHDIIFDVFFPMPHCDRYYWKSKRKIFLYDISANGTHFYVADRMDNKEIQVRTAEMLQAVIKTHIPKNYFVDTEAFDNLNERVDYKMFFE